jgi:hypothetical protein
MKDEEGAGFVQVSSRRQKANSPARFRRNAPGCWIDSTESSSA